MEKAYKYNIDDMVCIKEADGEAYTTAVKVVEQSRYGDQLSYRLEIGPSTSSSWFEEDSLIAYNAEEVRANDANNNPGSFSGSNKTDVPADDAIHAWYGGLLRQCVEDAFHAGMAKGKNKTTTEHEGVVTAVDVKDWEEWWEEYNNGLWEEYSNGSNEADPEVRPWKDGHLFKAFRAGYDIGSGDEWTTEDTGIDGSEQSVSNWVAKRFEEWNGGPFNGEQTITIPSQTGGPLDEEEDVVEKRVREYCPTLQQLHDILEAAWEDGPGRGGPLKGEEFEYYWEVFVKNDLPSITRDRVTWRGPLNEDQEKPGAFEINSTQPLSLKALVLKVMGGRLTTNQLETLRMLDEGHTACVVDVTGTQIRLRKDRSQNEIEPHRMPTSGDITVDIERFITTELPGLVKAHTLQDFADDLFIYLQKRTWPQHLIYPAIEQTLTIFAKVQEGKYEFESSVETADEIPGVGRVYVDVGENVEKSDEKLEHTESEFD